MTRTVGTMRFTSPFSGKQYTMSYQEDGRLHCSCPAFEHRGDCKHIDLAASQDMAAFYARKQATPRVRPSLTDIFGYTESGIESAEAYLLARYH